jgi:hypothetical protein
LPPSVPWFRICGGRQVRGLRQRWKRALRAHAGDAGQRGHGADLEAAARLAHAGCSAIG